MVDSSIDIETLVPHRGPSLLISEIVSVNETSAATRSTVTDRWPLMAPEGVDALVLVELIAQTAAVNNGWELRNREGPEADSRGWIVGIKSARLHIHMIPVGTVITAVSTNQFEYESFREIHGIARIGETVAAEVTLQLLQAKNSTSNG